MVHSNAQEEIHYMASVKPVNIIKLAANGGGGEIVNRKVHDIVVTKGCSVVYHMHTYSLHCL